jgi:hypothetical protein
VEEYQPTLPESLLIAKPASIDDLKFVFSQVEKRVKETADEGDRINSKSLTIIGICLTVMTGLIGYIVSNYKNDPIPLTGTAIYGIFSLFNICTLLKQNIYPIQYISVGSYPSDLLTDEIFEDLEENETPEYRMIYSEILEYQERVMINKNSNDTRNKLIKIAYDNLYQMPAFIAMLRNLSRAFAYFQA